MLLCYQVEEWILRKHYMNIKPHRNQIYKVQRTYHNLRIKEHPCGNIDNSILTSYRMYQKKPKEHQSSYKGTF